MKIKGKFAGQGMIKPRNYEHLIPPDIAYHVACGGKITREDRGYGYGSLYIWSCDECKHQWNDKTMKGYSLEDLELRFYLEPEPDDSTYIIVEVTECRNRFTRTMKAMEARIKGLQKIPDPTK